MSCTVAICTHNPRTDYLEEVLDSLRAQTLPANLWQLLLIDNDSKQPLDCGLDLSWHPNAKIVRESKRGLTVARLKAIAEADSQLLIFVDDDNVLDKDYLEKAVELGESHRKLGLWGCAHFTPRWEAAPPADFAPYLEYLAVGVKDEDRVSGEAFDYSAMPPGAGIIMRIEVARQYADQVANDPRRQALGRNGTGLGACEDFDLALTAVSMGYETGVFRSLRITHLMPASRIDEKYLQRLIENHARSIVLLMSIHGKPVRESRWPILRAIKDLLTGVPAVQRKIRSSRRRGEWQALNSLRTPQ